MKEMNDLFQAADWKQEKHSPVIETPESIKKGEFFSIEVSIGKEISHPNETKHHIRWIDVYFLPEGAKFPYQIGKAEFTAHGESVEGPDTSSVYTHHRVSLSFKTDIGGTIIASSYCNIHGLWQSSKKLTAE
jgi:superoxide reductase